MWPRDRDSRRRFCATRRCRVRGRGQASAGLSHEQLLGAESRADRGSIDRAADLAALYADKRWVDEMPEPLKRADVEAVPDEAVVVAVAEGQFSTFVADPPWRYGNTSTRGAAEDHYPTMSIDELCDLDVVRDHAADQAHLYLWATAGHLPDAFRVMDAWGFDYKTYLVWIKPQMGMGNYFRISTEVVLFGVRGGLRTNHRGLMNYFQARRGKHSSKPAMFHDLVMKASPGPYLELFSRCQADTMLMGCGCAKCRLGWSAWGNQS